MRKTLTMVLGGILVLVGLLGFVNDPVLGLFEVDMLHNLVHLLTGAAGLYVAMQGEGAMKLYGKVFTVVYALVTVLGFMTPGEPSMLLGLMEINGADNVLHLLLTAAFAYIGFGPSKREAAHTA